MPSTPIVKKPQQPAAFPPVNRLRAYRVRDGDNWWVLQKRFGLRDPWDLIRYNFATRDPAEVNWYLREYLGCTRTTADGKNYCFSSAAKPGLLYLPRRNFKRGGGSDTGPSSAQLTTNDRAAEKSVVWALGLSSGLNALDFEINGFQVTPHDYDRVRRLIREGEIYVAYDRNLGNSATYDTGADTLYYGKAGGGDTQSAALIIHEATHAAFDARGVHIADSISEVVAYVAQMLFIMARDPKGRPPHQSDPLANAIFLPAWRFARRIRDKQLDREEEYSTKPWEDIKELMKALMAHHRYREQFLYADTYYEGLAGYDGVKGWVYSDG